jgi:hypothetical protein
MEALSTVFTLQISLADLVFAKRTPAHTLALGRRVAETAGGDYNELVSAQTAHYLGLVKLRFQSRGELLQQVVASNVAVSVVYRTRALS